MSVGGAEQNLKPWVCILLKIAFSVLITPILDSVGFRQLRWAFVGSAQLFPQLLSGRIKQSMRELGPEG